MRAAHNDCTHINYIIKLLRVITLRDTIAFCIQQSYYLYLLFYYILSCDGLPVHSATAKIIDSGQRGQRGRILHDMLI